MSTKNPIGGKTLRFTFTDGQMAGKTFEHSFGADGTLAFRMVGAKNERNEGEKPAAPPTIHYEVAPIREDVCAVSYLSPAGYTLTTVLDFATSKLVAFSSNDKTLGVQHGSFAEADAPGRHVRDAHA